MENMLKCAEIIHLNANILNGSSMYKLIFSKTKTNGFRRANYLHRIFNKIPKLNFNKNKIYNNKTLKTKKIFKPIRPLLREKSQLLSYYWSHFSKSEKKIKLTKINNIINSITFRKLNLTLFKLKID